MRHVVVAWQPTRESTRALHDALPLLARAESIDVVTVDATVGERRMARTRESTSAPIWPGTTWR